MNKPLNDDVKRLIGKRLQEVRENLHMTQTEFCEFIYPEKIPDTSQLSNKENGKKLTLDYLIDVSRKTNIPLAELVGTQEIKKKQEYTLREICKILALLYFSSDIDITIVPAKEVPSINICGILAIKIRKLIDIFPVVKSELEIMENSPDRYKEYLSQLALNPDSLDPIAKCLIDFLEKLPMIKKLDSKGTLKEGARENDLLISSPKKINVIFNTSPLTVSASQMLDNCLSNIPNLTMRELLLKEIKAEE